MAITKVRAHVDENALTDPHEIYLAKGNAEADRVAKGAAEDLLSKPSPAEIQDWARQTRFLKAYLQYVPRVLEKWPSLAPSSGRASLPKRDATQDGGPRRRTFQADVLGEWGARPAFSPTPPSTSEQNGPSGHAGEDRAAAADTGPTPNAPPRTAHDGPRAPHEWSNRQGTWYCRVCLAVSRATHPPLTQCPGLAANLANAVCDPKGHTILVSPRSDNTGIVLICSRCGHYAASNRPTNLHKKVCQGIFESPGALESYRRFSRGVHPRYAEGPAKVLESAFPATWLLQRRPPEDTETPT
jgi:hypothetical protein